jgi:hypothetical protein
LAGGAQCGEEGGRDVGEFVADFGVHLGACGDVGEGVGLGCVNESGLELCWKSGLL